MNRTDRVRCFRGMSFMRPWSLILLLLGCASCVVRVPQPRGVAVSVNAAIHANARIEVAQPLPPPPPPKPPEPAVELQGAPVVEFFGIPLEGAPDVVFVLDCSGSMDELAQGRIAQISSQGGQPGQDAQGGQPGQPGQPGQDAQGAQPGQDGQGAQPGQDAQSSPGSQSSPAEQSSPPAAPRKIDVARNELVDALQRLPAGTHMNVIFFNRRVEAFAPGMIPLEESGREGLIGFVKEMTATGSTALVPAMRTAFLMNARRIVLLSDGLGNVGGDSRALLRDAREAMRGGVRIDTIGLGRTQDAELLQTLARESGGLYQAL